VVGVTCLDWPRTNDIVAMVGNPVPAFWTLLGAGFFFNVVGNLVLRLTIREVAKRPSRQD
jgi:hypothetical protein